VAISLNVLVFIDEYIIGRMRGWESSYLHQSICQLFKHGRNWNRVIVTRIAWSIFEEIDVLYILEVFICPMEHNSSASVLALTTEYCTFHVPAVIFKEHHIHSPRLLSCHLFASVLTLTVIWQEIDLHHLFYNQRNSFGD